MAKEGIFAFVASIDNVQKELSAVLSGVDTRLMQVYYMEYGVQKGDKHIVARKTLEYGISSTPGPNSRYDDYKIRQYFSPETRHQFDAKEAKFHRVDQMTLTIGRNHIMLDNETGAYYETHRFHTLLQDDVHTPQFRIQRGATSVLFDRIYTTKLCQALRNRVDNLSTMYENSLKMHATGQSHVSLFSPEFLASNDQVQDEVRNIRKDIDTICILSACHLSFCKEIGEKKGFAKKGLSYGVEDRYYLQKETPLQIPRLPGQVAVIYLEGLYRLLKQIEFMMKQPVYEYLKKFAIL